MMVPLRQNHYLHYIRVLVIVRIGKLLCKNEETDVWEAYLLELQPDRLYRKPLGGGTSEYPEYCHLHASFVKKFNHSDPKMPGFRYGIRLQMGSQLSHFLADSADTFKKWYIL
jgi:hypothetical protein